MDVKIGVLHSPRELTVDTEQTPDEVREQVSKVLGDDDQVLELTDRRGRRIIVPVKRIAYVEIGEGDGRRVGFMTS
ncbi:DUF3107 family protein [Epidermidibacterium keratini]|uniref:DUF3107 family protein n=1 Tax=Epidermidibacterium keratini TaxID=1891644 RepID=A0A7L4YRL1_9ACTN|nr:DUF3107 domain-containing protein [Epidermidibacterium keratini]QHC01593.1 DUF3107 family protein [Epidermidibacterium keratini]